MSNADFTTTHRDGKLALWVNRKNIWDIRPDNYTDDVRKAIISAYRIGVSDAMDSIHALAWDIASSHSGIIGDFKEVGE